MGVRGTGVVGGVGVGVGGTRVGDVVGVGVGGTGVGDAVGVGVGAEALGGGPIAGGLLARLTEMITSAAAMPPFPSPTV